MLVDVKVREYVSVHARYVIQVIDRKAAEENA
jgi:hydrogenase maturation factor